MAVVSAPVLRWSWTPALFAASLVTLLPLPFIGWLIHRVRDKLPGAQAAKEKTAADGKPPWSGVFKQIEDYIAEKAPHVKAEYTLHDESKEGLR